MQYILSGVNTMTAKEILASKEFGKCIEFHGHVCPGVAIGFQAARLLMDRLGVGRAPDEELVATVETDACGADAIQVMTGCTFGKGNFLFKDHGKHAFSLADRKQGKTVRVCLRPAVLSADPEHLSLFEKVRTQQATPEETERFKQLRQERLQSILAADPESLFTIEEIPAEIPPKARIVESGICDVCGELTMVERLSDIDGKKVCIPCTHRISATE
jgi:formylmethanofuran dehydrogenase subunit E